MLKILLIALLFVLNVNAKLVDKVAGVINDKIITLSEVQRVQETLSARVEISSMIYPSKKMDANEIVNLINRIYIVKDKLSELGFVVTDESVESSISDTEKRLRLKRPQLLSFLRQKGISFEEYFELIRVTKEYNIFMQRIIAPLVSITEQDLKNEYYKSNSNSKTLSFKYNIVDFYFSSNEVIKSEIPKLPAILSEYQKTGNIPDSYKNVQVNNLGTLADEDLPSDFSKALKVTEAKSFSKPVVKGGMIHVFYLKTKDLTESEDYVQKKNYYYEMLFRKKSDVVVDSWFDKEISNYYILNNL